MQQNRRNLTKYTGREVYLELGQNAHKNPSLISSSDGKTELNNDIIPGNRLRPNFFAMTHVYFDLNSFSIIDLFALVVVFEPLNSDDSHVLLSSQ